MTGIFGKFKYKSAKTTDFHFLSSVKALTMMHKLKIIALIFIGLSTISNAQIVDRVDGSPFPGTVKPDTLFYTSNSMSESEIFATGSLSGILARTKPMILQWQYFHQEIVREQGSGFKIFTTYSNDFSGLLKFFASRLDGYILCDPKSASSNVAASLSGILNAIAIPSDIEAKAIAAGLTKKLDVSGKNELWALTNYRDQLNKNIAFSQSNDNWLGLVDYSAYTGGLRFWDSSLTGITITSVFNFLNQGATIYGWWVSEDGMINKLSQKGFKMIPCGGLKNLATLTNLDVPIAKQKVSVNPYKVVPNVHTVCFVISDGDNIGWVAGAGYWDQWIWKNDNQSRLNLGFTLSPALCELTPIIYNDLINGLQTSPEGRNLAVASPSGVGYYFPSLSPNQPYHCEQLNKFMRKADMSIVNVIDTDFGTHSPDEYLKQSNIDALFYYTYGAQYTGMKGKISWYKGKPSIGGRFTFWGNSSDRGAITQDRVAQTLANVLNSQSTNINSEAGYSLVPVHIWTENPHDVLHMIQKLGPNVRVVAPDEFVWLIRKNVGSLPMGTGMGLNASYYFGNRMDSLAYSKIDREIDYQWKNKPVTQTDSFSVRWSGQIQPLFSEDYNFSVASLGRAKLTVNDSVLFDALNLPLPVLSMTGSSDSLTTLADSLQNGHLKLIAGQKYNIVLEYSSDGNTTPSCMLNWESTTQIKQVVPFTQLYAEPIPTTGLVSLYRDKDRKGFSAGLKLGSYTLGQLRELGIDSMTVSSVNLMEGFKMKAYSGDHFTGDSLLLTVSADSISAEAMSDGTNFWDNKIKSVRVLPNGDPTLTGAFVLKNQKTFRAMQVAGGVTATDYNVNIEEGVLTKNFAQTFEFKHLGDGVYTIMARNSKKILTVQKMGTEENSNIHQWSDENSNSQKFIAVAINSTTYKFVSVYTGLVIGNSGTNVVLSANTTKFSGAWNLVKVPTHEGSGDGLMGSYYTGTSFGTLKTTRVDPQVYFNWGESIPITGLSSDNFSVRWTGYIEPRYTGTYTFYITSDNGRKLWINDQLIIDKWINDYDITYSGTINLKEMTKYPIRLDYFETTGGANIRFEWSSDFETQEMVPQSQLYSGLTTEVRIPTTNADVYVYVDQAGDRLFVKGLEEPVQFRIVDALGRVLVDDFGVYANISTLSAGVYVVSFNHEGIHNNLKFYKH